MILLMENINNFENHTDRNIKVVYILVYILALKQHRKQELEDEKPKFYFLSNLFLNQQYYSAFFQ